MFLSVFDMFKIGIGPSSSHTMGPMVAAGRFLDRVRQAPFTAKGLRATLHGSLAFTGRGHATDRATILGLAGFRPDSYDAVRAAAVLAAIQASRSITPPGLTTMAFDPARDLIFDYDTPLPGHPNAMVLAATDAQGDVLLRETYYSIGGGFVMTATELANGQAADPGPPVPFPFRTAAEMLAMAAASGHSIAAMKRANELARLATQDNTARLATRDDTARLATQDNTALPATQDDTTRLATQDDTARLATRGPGLSGLDTDALDARIARIWSVMSACIDRGLTTDGILPGGLQVRRRAKGIHDALMAERGRNLTAPHVINDWICAYAMAVNEQNAAGGQVVTAPTNGAAGVVPAVIRYWLDHVPGASAARIPEFLLTAAAIGGLVKYNASISGAEAGCQAEVGSAAAMAAAGLAAVLGGTPEQIENAAEIALEHHLGMTCDPVKGLVQVPCIERNGLGAVKAVSAASLALRGDGQHLVSLDVCIETMRQTGRDMHEKYKETSLGGLAVNVPNC